MKHLNRVANCLTDVAQMSATQAADLRECIDDDGGITDDQRTEMLDDIADSIELLKRAAGILEG